MLAITVGNLSAWATGIDVAYAPYPYVNFQLTGSSRCTVTAHVYVDAGAGAILLTTALGKRLGLNPAGKPLHALRGKVGARNTVLIERDGKPLTIRPTGRQIL